MLLPSEIDSITEYINKHFVILEDELVNEIADRISKVNEANITTLNQVNILNQMGLLNNQVYKKVAKATNKTETEIKGIISSSMITSFKRDNIIFSKQLINDKLKISESLMQTLQADISRLNFNLSNLTGTTAMTTQTAFLNAVNQAHLEVISGAKSYTSAMIDAIDKVSKDGIDVLYPSGHKDKIEVATRRAIVTSVNQTNGELQLKRMQELGWDLVEVSAHIGARPTHAEWQGKVYSLTGKNGYKNFYDATEYGTMLGLCGINCRHTFFPYYKGSTLSYNAKELEEINNKKVSFNGKKMSYYQATQYQRYLERNIRQCTRQVNGNKQLLLNNKDIDIDQVKYSINMIQAKKNGLLNELKELEKQVGLKQSNRLYAVGNEVKLLKNPSVKNTLFTNVKKNDIIEDIKEKAVDILTEADKKKIEKRLVENLLEGNVFEDIDTDYLEKIYNSSFKFDLSKTDDLKIVNDWSGYVATSNSFYINEALRNKGYSNIVSESQKKTIDAMDRLTHSYKLEKGIKTYRFVADDYLDYTFGLDARRYSLSDISKVLNENCKGKEILTKQYTSLSAEREKNVFKSRPVELRISIPEGSDIFITDNYSESELILPRDINFKFKESEITNANTYKEKIVLYLEVMK